MHGRWYSPELGRFLSPNEKGDYMYGGDGPWVQDPVNCALVTRSRRRSDTQRIEDFHYACVEGYGQFDVEHARNFGYPTGSGITSQQAYWNDFRREASRERDFNIRLSNGSLYINTLSIDYWVSGHVIPQQYEGVAMGIFQDFAREFEAFQLVRSNFANQDLPSDYVGLVAVMRGKTLEEAFTEFGDVTYTGTEFPPETWLPTDARNYEFTPRIRSGWRWVNTPWPTAYQVDPINDHSLWRRRELIASYAGGLLQTRVYYIQDNQNRPALWICPGCSPRYR